MIKGIGASGGIAIGKAFIVSEHALKVEKKRIEDKAFEIERFRRCVKKAEEEIKNIIEVASKTLGAEETEIFEAHLLILQDPEFLGTVEMKINSEGVNSEFALEETITMFVSVFEDMGIEYMMERAGDVKDVGGRLMNLLLGVKTLAVGDIKDQSIIVKKDLTPSDTAQLNKEKVLGFVTGIGGRTSHSAIMARTLGIPAVVGLGTYMEEIKQGDLIILNGDDGEIIINPQEETLLKFKNFQQSQQEEKNQLMALVNEPAITLDGKGIELAGNIGSPEDARLALMQGAQGIGLFRTEFLYMDKDKLPSEEEQFNSYKEVLENMRGKGVIIRTLDIGGDKKLNYLPLTEELNPFLGCRALRLCLKEKHIFKTQLRALLRASVYGNLKIMFPMVSGVEEIVEVKKLLREVKQELSQQGIGYRESIEIGIMIEIPSAAIISDLLAKEVDFFSIGTNDLIQYTIAVDRMNEDVSYLYNPLHPAILRLVKLVINNAHKEGKWVGICGEMASDLRAVQILIGMGIDELSMSAGSIPKVKDLIRNSNYEHCKIIVEKVLNLSSPEEIEECLKKQK
ncbi:phosphotransferase system enzyme I (PtsI) [Clostridium punense]|uniref:Phosphoenolpyruvate-protein phosphotransferase n=1 Tax=Clostridium punense TaxID=1054297 RepID=A0ABS4K7M1_9CLOT|nr:phosphoenolpyruvate--protein phosphotransferase [Clostridium punense]MBP2023295.1 phosphotransferase system enzyme I (PtsI) [Clostridium punense]